tara:strand:+ start:12376 stop:13197 length:822 start_codon:yes stop_codon:yes gene_type:complete
MSNPLTHSSTKIFLSTQGQNLVLNSATLNTDINFYFSPILLANADTSHFVIGLEQASIPISINMINSKNNTLTINGNTYTLPAGNYTIAQVIVLLNAFFTTFGVTFTYSSTTNLITTTATAGSFTINSTTMGKNLGFVAGTYSSPYTNTKVVNLTSTLGIVIQLDNVQTANKDNSGSNGATLARIPITCTPTKILQYFNATPFFSQIANRELTYLRVRLLNDDYTPLELVGNPDWFLVIRVDFSEKNMPTMVDSLITTQRKETERALLELAPK